MYNLIRIATADLASYLNEHLPALSSNWWHRNVLNCLTPPQLQTAQDRGFSKLEDLDFAALLKVLDRNWYELRQNYNLSREGQVWIKELQSIRNKWAHLSLQKVEAEEVYRDADTMGRALKELGAPQASLDEIEKIKSNALSKMVPSREATSQSQQDYAEPKDLANDPIPNHHPLPSGIRDMHICEQLVISARYLEAHGFTQQQLSSVHHSSLQGREEAFNSTYDYFGERNRFGEYKNLQARNLNYAHRLIFIAIEHQKHREGFSILIQQALEKWPLW